MAQPLGRSNGPYSGPPSYLNSLRCASFKVDEGYSEDTRSQSENDTIMRSDSRLGEAVESEGQLALPDWVHGMSEAERSDFTYAILRTLRTSSIADIVERLNPLLHLDPVFHLPPEITSLVFSYLSPQTLLRTTTLSQTWRGRALDSQLWRLLFRLEGWTADLAQVRMFEEEERIRRLNLRERKSRARYADRATERHATKKRVFEGAGESPISMTVDDSDTRANGWAEQHGRVEADESPTNSPDRMQDVSFHGGSVMPGSSTNYTGPAMIDHDMDPGSATAGPYSLVPPLRPSLLLEDSEDPKINWHYLYKQKKRLEDNWNAGRFANFQFPHPNYPQEAHTECVYTIQYSGRHMVSGSRDKSVRIWDMETQRLVKPPLLGHHASVLCLQFDDSPEQDVVISGGSDCHVFIWQFSTGKMIKQLRRAHSESVLNLRFDENYLITCSKDKTIKVWNRKELMPTDETYPTTTKSSAKFPSYIIDMAQVPDPRQLQGIQPLPEYKHIMSLEGHSAAVNAIQIYDKQIVSASGDRTVKIWDVRTGQCIKTVPGHTKGIACVQFDGRRIVSGSSDESVRIFDRITGAEVACLQGHTNLVRTVQASFGDLPGNEEELEAEARKIDTQFFEARESGALDGLNRSRSHRRPRNAGSRDPQKICAYGAKLPPGGGGSRWARIVSGSYDESVIIWKKDPSTGDWVIGKILLQNDAVRSAGGRPRRTVQPAPPPHHHHQPQGPVPPTVGANNANNVQPNAATTATPNAANQLAAVQANFQALAAQAHAQVAHAQMLAQQAQALHQQANQAQVQQTVPTVPVAQNAQQSPIVGTNTSGTTNHTGAGAEDVTVQTVPQMPIPVLSSLPQQQGQVQPPTAASSIPNSTTGLSQPANISPVNGPGPAAQTTPQAAQPGQPHHHHHNHNHHGHGHGHGHNHHHHHPLNPLGIQQGTNSRVFKLQFDARRIVCCSQDPIIVGWDFANGDEDIISASRFFGELNV